MFKKLSKNNNKEEGGFILVLSLIIIMLMVTITIFISGIFSSQHRIYDATVQTQIAEGITNAAAECALYWAFHSPPSNPDEVVFNFESETAVSPENYNEVQCEGVSLITGKRIPQPPNNPGGEQVLEPWKSTVTGNHNETFLYMRGLFNNEYRCAYVKVERKKCSTDIHVKVSVIGYNTCDFNLGNETAARTRYTKIVRDEHPGQGEGGGQGQGDEGGGQGQGCE